MAYIKVEDNKLHLFVNIHKSFNRLNKNNPNFQACLYDCTRRWWKISGKKLNEIAYLVGHDNGEVKCVIEPNNWVFNGGRYECNGTDIATSPYIGKNIRNIISPCRNCVTYYKNELPEPNELCYVENIREIYLNDEARNLEERRASHYQIVLFRERDDARLSFIVDNERFTRLQNNELMTENSYVKYNADNGFSNASRDHIVINRRNFINEFVEHWRINEDSIELLNSMFIGGFQIVKSYHVNVGHGNCTLILTLDNHYNYNLMMVDCGLYDKKFKVNPSKNLELCLDAISNIINVAKNQLKIKYFMLTHTL